MPPIRNSCVARGTAGASGTTVLYQVPAATVLLCKDVRFTNGAASAITMTLYVSAPGVILMPVASSTVGAGAYWSWSGWIALNASDTVVLGVSATGSIPYWISGALLPQIPGY